MLTLYRPGDSVLHRLPTGVKLLMMAGVTLLLVTPMKHVSLSVAAVLVAVGYVVTRCPLRVVWSIVRPLLYWVVVVGAVTAWSNGWAAAATSSVVLVVAVLAAGLVTITTRTEDMMDTIVRLLTPLKPLGVNPDAVALAFSLALRVIPVISGFATTVREAQHARGLGSDPRAFLSPLVVRSVRYADVLGQALVARGYDDPDD